VDAIERALELDDGSDANRRVLLLALQSQELLYEHDRTRRQTVAREAIALAADIDDPRIKARVLQHVFHGLWSPDMAAVRAGLANDLLASAQAAEDRALEFWANLLLLHVSFETGDFVRTQALRDREQELADALAQPTLDWIVQLEAAALTLFRGDLVAGEKLAREALERGGLAGQPDALQVFGEQRAFIRLYQGRGDEQLIELSRQAALLHPSMAVWGASTAQYEAHFGNQETARALLRNAVENRFEHVGWDTLRLVALSFYTDAAARLGARDAAELIHELLTPWQDQLIWSGALGYGHVRLWLGIAAATLGRDAEADEHFAFACSFHDDHGLSLWSARSQLGWAEALAERGAHEQAREHAARALELARENGYGLLEALASQLHLAEPPERIGRP
jgi:tetratricopeptide (TPR) repeat protein